MQPTPDQSKIHSLHGLRGVMAWWVVVGHISLALGWNLPLVDRNTLAVDVFVLLSGFVIALLVERKRESYRDYIIRRGFRLFPVYLLILVFSSILLPVQLFAWTNLVSTPANINRVNLAQEAISNFPWNFAVHVPLLQGLIPKALGGKEAYTIVGQAWSISLEWQFYLLAPFIIYAMMARQWMKAVVIAVPILLLTHFFTGAFLGAKILLFVVGIVTHFALRPERRREACIAAVICAGAAIAKDGVLQVVPLAIWVTVIISSIKPAHSWGHLLAKLLGSRVLFHLGEVSYSVYLIHMVPLYVSIYACSRLGIENGKAGVIIAASTVLATYALSVASYFGIEKPGIRMGARLTRARP